MQLDVAAGGFNHHRGHISANLANHVLDQDRIRGSEGNRAACASVNHAAAQTDGVAVAVQDQIAIIIAQQHQWRDPEPNAACGVGG